jgi:hypothetical protein
MEERHQVEMSVQQKIKHLLYRHQVEQHHSHQG